MCREFSSVDFGISGAIFTAHSFQHRYICVRVVFILLLLKICSFILDSTKMQSHFLLILMPLVLSISMADNRTKSLNENHQQAVLPKSTKAPVLIDSIRQHYLGLENDLWSLMDSGIDNSYVLDRIHTVHLQFFVENFGELNVTFCDYAFDRQIELFDAVTSINQTILLVLEKSLRQNPLAFDEKATIETNRRQIDLTHQLEILFNMTGTSEFYETIQRVSGQ